MPIKVIEIESVLPSGVSMEDIDLQKLAAAIRLKGYDASINNDGQFITDAPQNIINEAMREVI